jgi:hypothetical protein
VERGCGDLTRVSDAGALRRVLGLGMLSVLEQTKTLGLGSLLLGNDWLW